MVRSICHQFVQIEFALLVSDLDLEYMLHVG